MTESTARRLARAHLELSRQFYKRREALQISIEELAAITGLGAEEIEMIEEGDTTSVPDILVICDALGVTVTLSPDYYATLSPAKPVVLRQAAVGD